MRYRYAVPDGGRKAKGIVHPRKLRIARTNACRPLLDGRMRPIVVSEMHWRDKDLFSGAPPTTVVELSFIARELPDLYRLHTELMTNIGYIVEWKIPEKEDKE